MSSTRKLGSSQNLRVGGGGRDRGGGGGWLN